MEKEASDLDLKDKKERKHKSKRASTILPPPKKLTHLTDSLPLPNQVSIPIKKKVQTARPSDSSTPDEDSESASSFVQDSSDIPKIMLIKPPPLDSVVYQTQCHLIIDGKTILGDMILTYEALYFITKQIRPPFMYKVIWPDCKETAKVHKRGIDKGITLTTVSNSITFSAIKDRETTIYFMKLIASANKNPEESYGFITKDDTEVVRRIVQMRAPHVIEDVTKADLNTIMKTLRESDLTEMYTVCGCSDVVTSRWSKTKNGISRTIQYTQPMFQSLSVASTQTLMKKGDICVFEISSKFSRSYAPHFLHMNMQYYFQPDGEATSMRVAYIPEWQKDTWDKEFVAAAVQRQVKMNFYYLKGKFTGEAFNKSLYEDKWKQHQSYVLVITALIITILVVIFFPADTDWYSLMAAFVVLFALFYF